MERMDVRVLGTEPVAVRWTGPADALGLEAEPGFTNPISVEAKVRQYAVGSAFTSHVVLAAGMDGFNRIWESPQTLPTRAELAEPGAWIRRVL